MSLGSERWRSWKGMLQFHLLHYFVNKGLSSQSYGFSSSHVWMWQLDYKESWMLKNWCFWSVVLEKTLESPLDCKEVQPVHPKENLSWIFIGRTDAEAETPILWPPPVKNWFIGKDPGAGKDWRWEKKGTTEDEMVEWHHRLSGHELVNSRSWWWTGRPGMCCSPWSHKELDKTVTELNWTPYLLGQWLLAPLPMWHCQALCDSSSCATCLLDPQWNRSVRG